MPSETATPTRWAAAAHSADATAAQPEPARIDEVDPEGELARGCLRAYYAELARRFPEGFEVARSRDPAAAAMRRPRGVFLVASRDGQALGCVGLKGGEGDRAEIKRLWVAPQARGQRLAQRLMQAAEQAAGELGLRVLRLDSHRSLHEAIALYRRSGWVEIARFNDDPYAQVFFEKRLPL